MARFDVYAIKGTVDRPLVVDVQADFLESLRTRVVIPLIPLANAEREAVSRLKPIIDIVGERHVLMTTDIGTVPNSMLGDRVASIEGQRQMVTDALDFLFQGF